METVAAGVALIPEKRAIEALCALNSDIVRAGGAGFVLKATGRGLPHLSLFQGVFSRESLDEMTEALRRVAEDRGEGMTGDVKGIAVWSERIFFLDVRRTAGLVGLHRRLVRELDPLRVHGAGPADPQAFSRISQKERRSLTRYAYPFAGSAFRPHFTIGRWEEGMGDKRAMCRALERRGMPMDTIRFERLILFEVGRYGRFERRMAGVKL